MKSFTVHLKLVLLRLLATESEHSRFWELYLLKTFITLDINNIVKSGMDLLLRKTNLKTMKPNNLLLESRKLVSTYLKCLLKRESRVRKSFQKCFLKLSSFCSIITINIFCRKLLTFQFINPFNIHAFHRNKPPE